MKVRALSEEGPMEHCGGEELVGETEAVRAHWAHWDELGNRGGVVPGQEALTLPGRGLMWGPL